MLERKNLSAIAERDVDLIVVEEFMVNDEFCDWFSSRVFGMRVLATSLGAWHSLSDDVLGESDIVHIFKSLEGGGLMALLIENKIDAPSQPRQAVRYRERGEKGRIAGLWDGFKTCVIAPAKYLATGSKADGYDGQISYEEILSFFVSRERRDQRFRYKADVIREGIEKHRHSYQPTISREMTQFVENYCALSSKEYPQLKVFPAKPRPAGSTWVSFRPKGYPQMAILSHQLTGGKVKLFLSDAAQVFDEWEQRFRPYLTPDISLERAGKSIALSLDVPVVDPLGRPFSDQEPAVRQALEAATKIDAVYRKAK